MCRQCNNPKYIAHSDIYFISYKKYMKEVYYSRIDVSGLWCYSRRKQVTPCAIEFACCHLHHGPILLTWINLNIMENNFFMVFGVFFTYNAPQYDNHDKLFHLFVRCCKPVLSYEVVGGYIGFTPSVRLSVRLSVRPACGVRSVTSTVLDGFFPY